MGRVAASRKVGKMGLGVMGISWHFFLPFFSQSAPPPSRFFAIFLDVGHTIAMAIL